MENKDSCRSWFCVLNNPEKVFEGSERDIAEKVLDIWIDNKSTRTGAVAYCISVNGLHHLHMVFEDTNMCRFSALKKLFPKAHIEPTKGNKTQAEDYINKKGKFEEKGEQVIYVARFGEIKGYQGQRRDIEIISELIDDGKTPVEIFETNFVYRKYANMIKAGYFDKRNKETSFIRPVKTYWHIGDSGSGKSYTAQNLIDKYGESALYLLSDYDNGGFDNYCGERILFMDEFRGQIKYPILLKMLDCYKMQIHARYSNSFALWNEVHITSVLTPQACYPDITHERVEHDTIVQLKRRIDFIVYHEYYNGEYMSFMLDFNDFVSYTQLRFKAREYWNFVKQFDDYEEVL